ncbi:MAG: DUF3592 domain-containing protein [Deltaproteobacteria bacterium]|nr:DUF3592 domain-containing protein [Deltaproteobacteria bacterium]
MLFIKAFRRAATLKLPLAAVACLALGIRSAYLQASTANWVATEGEIITALFDGTADKLQFDLSYSYSADGKGFSGSRLSLDLAPSETLARLHSYSGPERLVRSALYAPSIVELVWNEEKLSKMFERWKPGSRIVVYYDPKDPTLSVLQIDRPWFEIATFRLGLVLLLITVLHRLFVAAITLVKRIA